MTTPILSVIPTVTPETFETLLPRRMRCTDQFENGLSIRSRKAALRRPYLAPNSRFETRFLLFDYDHEDGMTAWRDAILPMPNLLVFNKENRHSHIFYVLSHPVLIGGRCREKPILYLNAVVRGMTRRLDADPHYARVLAKNPLSSQWRTEWLRSECYSLGELGNYLHAKNTRFAAPSTGGGSGGRNVTLFDELRGTAYSLVLKYKRAGYQAEDFQRRLFELGMQMNLADNPVPLPCSEVRHISKSVAKFTWQEFSEREFSRLQSYRAKQKSLKSCHAVEDLKAHAGNPPNRPMPARDLGSILGLSARSARRYWAQPRAAYEANSSNRGKPWQHAGMSRASWYRTKRHLENGV